MAVATRQEYGLFVNGELVEAEAGDVRELNEPATGEPLARVAMAGEAVELPNPKLGRLRQGYCARNGCDSFYYRVHLGDYVNLDWAKIREKADSP